MNTHQIKIELINHLKSVPGVQDFHIRTLFIGGIKTNISRNQNNYIADLMAIIQGLLDSNASHLNTLIDNVLIIVNGGELYDKLSEFQRNKLSVLIVEKTPASSIEDSDIQSYVGSHRSIYDGYDKAIEVIGSDEKTTLRRFVSILRMAHGTLVAGIAVYCFAIITKIIMPTRGAITADNVWMQIPTIFAHALLYLDTDAFYKNYIDYWEITSRQRIETALLWLVYIAALMISVYYSPAWMLALSGCMWAIVFKNLCSKHHIDIEMKLSEADHPAAMMLSGWITRSATYASTATLLGAIILILSFERLHCYITDTYPLKEPLRAEIQLHFWVSSLLAVFLTALVGFRRIVISFQNTFPRRERDEFVNQVNYYISFVKRRGL